MSRSAGIRLTNTSSKRVFVRGDSLDSGFDVTQQINQLNLKSDVNYNELEWIAINYNRKYC